MKYCRLHYEQTAGRDFTYCPICPTVHQCPHYGQQHKFATVNSGASVYDCTDCAISTDNFEDYLESIRRDINFDYLEKNLQRMIDGEYKEESPFLWS